MADLNAASIIPVQPAKVIDDPRDSSQPVSSLEKPKDDLDDLRSWVLTRVNQWRDWRRSNYELLWDKYERLWRGLWAGEDQNKKSERATLVTPGLGEAVENIVAEVEEALFGRGDSFDMKAKFNSGDDDRKIVDDNKALLKEDLGRGEFNANIGEALINAAVYGSGIGEILLETFTKREIAASVQAAMPNPMPDALQSMPGAMPGGISDAQMTNTAPGMMPGAPMGAPMPPMVPQTPPMGALGPSAPLQAKVVEKEVTLATLQSVNPRNFLIEPTARSVDKALGVAIEEYVGSHIINKGMKDGTYRKVSVGTSSGDTPLNPDPQVNNEYVYDKVAVIRYYGLVPKKLLFPPDRTVDLSPANEGDALGEALRQAESMADAATQPQQEEYVDLNSPENGTDPNSEEPIDAEMVEAVVVIANNQVCIKAIENPYLMKDRPVVAFPWDVVPGRFWGRGVCEKGLVPQMVMDAELRARIDALAYISAPMMAMDASRLPRGFQLTVRPGKSILTNGDPNQVLRPMHFGQLEQSTFTHSQQLDTMIQRATGSLDVMTMARNGAGDSRPGAVSMMLSGIVKRHKRTLMNFVDRFYVPALRKILWRNMQYDPERYTPRNWDFVASSTMGIIQREYESQNLVALMNTMDPTSPEYKMLLMGVVANTGLTHRVDIINMLKQSIVSAQQTAAAQAQAAASQAQMGADPTVASATLATQVAEAKARVDELNSRALLQTAKARNEALEPQFKSAELATKGIYQVAADQQKQVLNQRLGLMDRFLKAREIASNENSVRMQSQASLASETVRARAQVAAAQQNAVGAAAKAHHDARGKVAAAAVSAAAKPREIPASSGQLLG